MQLAAGKSQDSKIFLGLCAIGNERPTPACSGWRHVIDHAAAHRQVVGPAESINLSRAHVIRDADRS
jgi:hypothetical protein